MTFRTACNPGRRALVSLIAGAALLTAALPALAGDSCQYYEVVYFCGDVNGSCTITASDSLLTLKMGVGQVPDTVEADLSMDGEVTAVDALRVLRIAVGSLPATLNCSNQRGIPATSTGFYLQTGIRSSNGYAVGWYTNNNDELRNYLVFDLSDLDGYITSGLLHLSTAPDPQTPYNSPDPSETYTLFDIATPIATLTSNGGTAAFADLAEGTVYGMFVASHPLSHVIDIAINGAGLDYLREASGLVALGGSITTLAKGDPNEYFFNSTSATPWRHLVVYVE